LSEEYFRIKVSTFKRIWCDLKHALKVDEHCRHCMKLVQRQIFEMKNHLNDLSPLTLKLEALLDLRSAIQLKIKNMIDEFLVPASSNEKGLSKIIVKREDIWEFLRIIQDLVEDEDHSADEAIPFKRAKDEATNDEERKRFEKEIVERMEASDLFRLCRQKFVDYYLQE